MNIGLRARVMRMWLCCRANTVKASMYTTKRMTAYMYSRSWGGRMDWSCTRTMNTYLLLIMWWCPSHTHLRNISIQSNVRKKTSRTPWTFIIKNVDCKEEFYQNLLTETSAFCSFSVRSSCPIDGDSAKASKSSSREMSRCRMWYKKWWSMS